MQEFHVGLPCLKLSLNPSNQRHHGKAAKTCSVKDAWDEMSDKRKGRDKTIDHDLTKDNVWLCGSTDMDMEQVIQAEIDRINAERAEHGKRKMRIDAVSAIEMIQKPPMEVMETLTREEQTKLLRVSDEVVESILHDWAPEWKTLATVIHYDEFGGRSGHDHKIFMPIARDKDGCSVLNAKRDFNLKFFTFMNREYPARMRDRGYPVLDCEIYEDMTEEERKQHAEKKKDYGLEGYEYKIKKAVEQEAQIAANEKIIEDQEEVLEVQKKLIAKNDKELAGQEKKITQAELNLSDINEDVRQAEEALQKTNDDLKAGKAKIDEQKKESKDLEIKILSKKRVEELAEPRKTLDGQNYKVPIEQYKSIVATAGQVDIFKDKYEKRKKAQDKRDKELDERCTELKNGWQELEKKRRMPMKEQQELAILHKLKESVLWLIEQPFVPEIVRKLLIRALGGENLSQMLGRTQKQLENRRQIER